MRSLLFILFLLFSQAIIAEDAVIIEIEIENHIFCPSIVKAPVNRKLKLIIHNKDNTIEEFESLDFHREKIIPPGKKAHIILAPLRPGEYNFYGEFHQDTAKGILIVE